MSDKEKLAMIDVVGLGAFYISKGMKKITVKNFNVLFLRPT